MKWHTKHICKRNKDIFLLDHPNWYWVFRPVFIFMVITIDLSMEDSKSYFKWVPRSAHFIWIIKIAEIPVKLLHRMCSLSAQSAVCLWFWRTETCNTPIKDKPKCFVSSSCWKGQNQIHVKWHHKSSPHLYCSSKGEASTYQESHYIEYLSVNCIILRVLCFNGSETFPENIPESSCWAVLYLTPSTVWVACFQLHISC